MINNLTVNTITVLDKDEALDVYVNKLGLEVGQDFKQGDLRWLTVRVPGDRGTEISLEQPGSPLHDDATAERIRELVTKGALVGLVFQADVSLHPPSPPPEPLLRLNLPRLCQEAVTNIVKHASASRVCLSLQVTPTQLRLVITDDGRGLPDGIESTGPAASAARSRGLGIMRRRAHQLGGTLDLVRGPGTTVRLTVPLPLQ